jgi:hypothetical protein
MDLSGQDPTRSHGDRLRVVFDQPEPPDFGALPSELSQDLETRFRRVPFDRIRRMADYYALRTVEEDHINRLARRFNLSSSDRDSVEDWWQERLHTRLAETLARFTPSQSSQVRRMKEIMRWQQRTRSNALFQFWFNTVGPGGRTWFANRYVGIRRRTFKLHWRP